MTTPPTRAVQLRVGSLHGAVDRYRRITDDDAERSRSERMPTLKRHTDMFANHRTPAHSKETEMINALPGVPLGVLAARQARPDLDKSRVDTFINDRSG